MTEQSRFRGALKLISRRAYIRPEAPRARTETFYAPTNIAHDAFITPTQDIQHQSKSASLTASTINTLPAGR